MSNPLSYPVLCDKTALPALVAVYRVYDRGGLIDSLRVIPCADESSLGRVLDRAISMRDNLRSRSNSHWRVVLSYCAPHWSIGAASLFDKCERRAVQSC